MPLTRYPASRDLLQACSDLSGQQPQAEATVKPEVRDPVRGAGGAQGRAAASAGPGAGGEAAARARPHPSVRRPLGGFL